MTAISSFLQIDTYIIFDPKIEISPEDKSCSIFDADSESEAEIDQFVREGWKQMSFGPKNMVFGVKMGQKTDLATFDLRFRFTIKNWTSW